MLIARGLLYAILRKPLLTILSSIIVLSLSANSVESTVTTIHAQESNSYSVVPYIGVNVRGFYTGTAQAKNASNYGPLPVNYYDDSFRIISQGGMNHVRFIYFWESYEKNPSLFMSELNSVAQAADKWGIKVLYDNHNFHTSSWLDPQRGIGFPWSLFKDNRTAYPFGSGGGTPFPSSKAWWTNWWNRSIKESSGTDGWTLLADFLKKIVNTVDKHPSTLGYEIINEPQIHSDDQWSKIGQFNTFMVNTLRTVTQKTLAYSQQIPSSPSDPTITMTPENMAKMAPANKTNVVFKISVYGVPTNPNTYQGERFNIFDKTAKLVGVPLYIGEWNNVKRQKTINEEGLVVSKINPQLSDINQTEANIMVQTFKNTNVWGMAYWIWNFQPHIVENYNLINATKSGPIQTTKYFDILKNSYNTIRS